jgi:hypothetical protein
VSGPTTCCTPCWITNGSAVGSLVGCGQVSGIGSGCGPVRCCWPGSRWSLTR